MKFLALTPGPDGAAVWKFPNVFDLRDPQGYYQTVCVPRQERQLKRYLNQQLHRVSKPAKAGADGGDPPERKPQANAKPTAGSGAEGAGRAGGEGPSGSPARRA